MTFQTSNRELILQNYVKCKLCGKWYTKGGMVTHYGAVHKKELKQARDKFMEMLAE